MVYLLIGEDSLSKDIKLNRLRQEFLTKNLEQFNLDILYARELNLIILQERLLCLPFKAKKRIILIREAQDLKEEIKEFMLKYVQAPSSWILLILDITSPNPRDAFINHISRHAKVFHFKETPPINTFSLSRQIELNRPDYALKVLNQLLKDGEKPERILGGLRYAFQNGAAGPLQARRRIRLLLNCDLDIKTGRIKPNFALEKLVVSLCSLKQPFH
jgi:DNA polymerase III delta subunit